MPSLERRAVDGRVESRVVGKSYSGKIIPHVAILAVVALGQAGGKVLHEAFHDGVGPWVMPPGRDLLNSKVRIHGGHCSLDELCGFVVAED